MHRIEHIAGLRAYAVIAVLLFHLRVPGFSGGFVGVDVFFVISGYLITGILKAEIAKTGRIDFHRFYVRRIKRLFPALILTLAITFIASSAILSPDHLARLAASTIYAAASASNILFWQEAGYFDVLEEFKPLLHTWSLSVEMQFYLVWPVVVLVACRWKPRFTPTALGVVATASFVANYIWSGETLFFLTPFRVFEFAIGGLLLWVPRFDESGWKGNMGTFVGLALLFATIFLYDGSTDFPRHLALVPCIAAAIVIMFGSSKIGGVLISNRATVSIGEISYSLYLVHWPLIVLYRYWKFGDQLTAAEQIGLLAISFVLAIAMYWLVERPLRAKETNPAKLWAGAIAAVAILAIPAASASTGGWEWRLNGVFPTTLQARETTLLNSSTNFCRVERQLEGGCDLTKARKIIVLGESHAPAMTYALRQARPDSQVIMISYLGCHDLLSVVDKVVVAVAGGDALCAEKAKFLNESPPELADVDSIVLASYRPYSYDANPFRFDLMDLLLSRTEGAKGFVLGDYFQTESNKPCNLIVQRRRDVSACLDPDFVAYVGDIETVGKEASFTLHAGKYTFIDTGTLFCPSLTNCPATYGGVPALIDSDHIYFSFAEHMIGTIVNEHGDFLRDVGFID